MQGRALFRWPESRKGRYSRSKGESSRSFKDTRPQFLLKEEVFRKGSGLFHLPTIRTGGNFTFREKQPPASYLKLCGQKQCAPQDRIQIQYVILINRARLTLVAEIQNAPREFKPVKTKRISPVKRDIVPYPLSDAFSSVVIPERRNRVRVPLHGQVVTAGHEAEHEYGCAEYLRAALAPLRVSRNSLS